MKTLKAIYTAAILALALSVPGYAGEISSPGVSCTGEISSPGVSDTAPGDIHTPGVASTGDISTPGFAAFLLALAAIL